MSHLPPRHEESLEVETLPPPLEDASTVQEYDGERTPPAPMPIAHAFLEGRVLLEFPREPMSIGAEAEARFVVEDVVVSLALVPVVALDLFLVPVLPAIRQKLLPLLLPPAEPLYDIKLLHLPSTTRLPHRSISDTVENIAYKMVYMATMVATTPKLRPVPPFLPPTSTFLTYHGKTTIPWNRKQSARVELV